MLPIVRNLTSPTRTAFTGGVAGAFGFRSLGFAATIPLAIVLAMTALRPLAEDVYLRYRLVRRQGSSPRDIPRTLG